MEHGAVGSAAVGAVVAQAVVAQVQQQQAAQEGDLAAALAAAAALAQGGDSLPVAGGAADGAGMDTDTETEDEDESEQRKQPQVINYKCKPRRKATQKPVGSDQKRQAFSKRKRGIVLKAYQLYKLTDAKVFIFMVNDKGSSWAYSSPGFGSALAPGHLRQMRELAGLPHTPKHVTEVMAHPKLDETDHRADDRHVFLSNLNPHHLDNIHLVPGAVPAPLHKGDVAVGPAPSAPASAAPALDGGPVSSSVTGLLGLAQQQQPPPIPTHARLPAKYQFKLQLDQDDNQPMPEPTGNGPDQIITPSGRRLAASVGIYLPQAAPSTMDTDSMGPPPPPQGDRLIQYVLNPSAAATEVHAETSMSEPTMPHMAAQAQYLAPDPSHSSGSESLPIPHAALQMSYQAYANQVVTDANGNIYRIVQDASAMDPSMLPGAPGAAPPQLAQHAQQLPASQPAAQAPQHLAAAGPHGALPIPASALTLAGAPGAGGLSGMTFPLPQADMHGGAAAAMPQALHALQYSYGGYPQLVLLPPGMSPDEWQVHAQGAQGGPVAMQVQRG